jgi:excisionase family DNA binding protein
MNESTEATREAAEQDQDLITRAEAAELAGVNTRTIDRWANEERITRYKVGGLQWVRFDRHEVAGMREPAAEGRGE